MAAGSQTRFFFWLLYLREGRGSTAGGQRSEGVRAVKGLGTTGLHAGMMCSDGSQSLGGGLCSLTAVSSVSSN